MAGKAPTRYPQLDLDRQVCFALYSASRAMTRAYAPILDEVGLTYPQYVTMLVLWEDLGEAVPMGELGLRLGLDSGTLTPLLKRLEVAGYLTRRRDPLDERRVLVMLTAAGISLRDQMARVPAVVAAKAGLGRRELEALRDQLSHLVDNLDGADA